ncbi:transcription antitermination factor NusB [Nakamurella sp.]|uniref:transcription antitermination factor NusB n=1 Tax=Nakamurella sp. TaxID=1869182 RepID=UPI003B3A2B3E
MVDPAREAALDVLGAVRSRGAYANLALPPILRERGLYGRDAALATELTYGTCRALGQLDAIIGTCGDRAFEDLDGVVIDALRLGAYQLLHTRIPPHAAVSSVVELVRAGERPGAAGYVNAVLRRVAEADLDTWIDRIAPPVSSDPLGRLAMATAHPRWIVAAYRDRLAADTPADPSVDPSVVGAADAPADTPDDPPVVSAADTAADTAADAPADIPDAPTAGAADEPPTSADPAIVPPASKDTADDPRSSDAAGSAAAGSAAGPSAAGPSHADPSDPAMDATAPDPGTEPGPPAAGDPQPTGEHTGERTDEGTSDKPAHRPAGPDARTEPAAENGPPAEHRPQPEDGGRPAAGPEDELVAALRADDAPPAVHLVARPGRIGRDELVEQSGGVAARYSPYGVYLTGGDPGAIAAVADGRAAVQDEGSQLVAVALATADLAGPDERWLDLTAGPGGKAGLLGALAAARGARLDAVEQSPHRADLVRRTTEGLPVTVHTADGRASGLPAGAFDRVLLDAPCTGLGALRRRPEARWRRRPSDVADLVELQQELLRAAADHVRVGGVIGYVTCSPHLAETLGVIGRAPAGLELVDARPFLPGVPDLGPGPTVQLWPHRQGTDGMFLALLRRTG